MIDLTNNPFDIDDDVATEKGEMEHTQGENPDAVTMNGPTSQETLIVETVEDERRPKTTH